MDGTKIADRAADNQAELDAGHRCRKSEVCLLCKSLFCKQLECQDRHAEHASLSYMQYFEKVNQMLQEYASLDIVKFYLSLHLLHKYNPITIFKINFIEEQQLRQSVKISGNPAAFKFTDTNKDTLKKFFSEPKLPLYRQLLDIYKNLLQKLGNLLKYFIRYDTATQLKYELEYKQYQQHMNLSNERKQIMASDKDKSPSQSNSSTR